MNEATTLDRLESGTCACPWNELKFHDGALEAATDPHAVIDLVHVAVTWGECHYEAMYPEPEEMQAFFFAHGLGSEKLTDLAVSLADISRTWKELDHLRSVVGAARAVLADKPAEDLRSAWVKQVER